jgi:hypothetical protein
MGSASGGHANTDPVVGHRLFTDGITCAVHRGPECREYRMRCRR